MPIAAMTPLPDATKSFAAQDPVVLLACCIFGEARGGTSQEKQGVGCVVRNRLRRGWHGSTEYAQVILQPYQFSCFLPDDPNSAKLLNPLSFEQPSVWDACYLLALQIFHDLIGDNTGGAVFYFSRPITRPPKAWGPVEFTEQYGGTFFFTTA